MAIHGNKSSRGASDSTPQTAEIQNTKSANTANTAIAVKSSPITKPFIMTLRDDKNIESAIMEALSPDLRSLKIITDSMKDYKSVSFTKEKTYSAKKKRYITTSKKIVRDFDFRSGIYVAHLSKDMKVVKVERVSSVYLDSNKYQNDQYLKNSYFTQIEMEKEI
jgi:hypothetical protein